MNQEHGTTFQTLALTFLAGAAVGAAVLALTTPKSGKELRGDLKDLGSRLKGRARDLMETNAIEA